MFPMYEKALLALVALAVAFAGSPETASGEEIDEAQAAATAPLPELFPERLREETLGYAGVATAMGQKEAYDATVTFAKGALEGEAGTQAVWRITSGEDGMVPRDTTLVLRQGDLAPLEFTIAFGPSRGRAAVVVFRKGGKEVAPRDETEGRPILLPAPVFVNLDVAVLAMPLTEGFETLARTLHLIPGRPLHWKVAVAGVENVSTPAGTFDAYKVALTCFDNDALSGSIWVTKDAPYRIIRQEIPYVLEMPAGRATLELARIGDADKAPNGGPSQETPDAAERD